MALLVRWICYAYRNIAVESEQRRRNIVPVRKKQSHETLTDVWPGWVNRRSEHRVRKFLDIRDIC